MRFFYEKHTYVLPGHAEVSVLERCPSYGMPVLRGFTVYRNASIKLLTQVIAHLNYQEINRVCVYLNTFELYHMNSYQQEHMLVNVSIGYLGR